MVRYEGPRVPIVLHAPTSPGQVRELGSFLRALDQIDLPRQEALYFFRTLANFLAVPKLDRERTYDAKSWWTFVDAENRSQAFRNLTVATTQNLLAARATEASAYTIATLAVRTLFGAPLDPDRVLDGPTSEVWIDPWVAHLKGRYGVRFENGWELDSILFKGQTNEIASLTFTNSADSVKLRALRERVAGRKGARNSWLDSVYSANQDYLTHLTSAPPPARRRDEGADYYVFALPIEQMAYYVNRSATMTYHDSSLADTVKLASSVAWMAGIQFYLSAPLGLPKGHIVCADSEWALTAIEQTLFWRDVRLPDTVQSILSVDISNWTKPGRFQKKEAYRCSADEIAHEVWKQLQASFNRRGGQQVLPDTILVDQELQRGVSYHLDDDIVDIYDRRKQAAYNRAQAARFSADVLLQDLQPEDAAYSFGTRLEMNVEPLLINRPGSLALRPKARTGIANMFLAADFVRTETNLACMEGANEAAKAAVNAILEESGASADACHLEPFEDSNLIAKALAWVAEASSFPGITETVGLASGAAGFVRTAVGRVEQTFKNWKKS
jgi:hypothetical protein